MVYDNTCKYLSEQYPEAFASWLLGEKIENATVLKTELSLEPILADSVVLLQLINQILHIEFQTLPISEPPIPFRALDYSVRLKRIYKCSVKQVVIFLQETTDEVAFTKEYNDDTTRHKYEVIRLWEQEPKQFLAHPALLPLAPLTKSNTPGVLFERVAREVAKIEEPQQQQNISACVAVLAGLRFNKNFIGQLLRRDLMRQSVIYQDILEEGKREGLLEGRQEGLLEGRQEGQKEILIRLLRRKIGTIEPKILKRIERLSISQLEKLGEALLDFSTTADLIIWLEEVGV